MLLVLGAGGVRGFAHLGVLERLEAEGVRVQGIVGCSVGGLVAAFYAGLGVPPAEMLRVGRSIAPAALLRHAWAHWTRRPDRAAWGTAGRTLGALREASFASLHRGVRTLGITAFDLVRRRRLLFTGCGEHREVTVSEAAIGGAAIPILFPPKRVHGGAGSYRLVDAGFLDALPLDAAIEAGCTDGAVLAVDLSLRMGLRQMWPAWWTRMRQAYGSRLVLIRPAVHPYGTWRYRSAEVDAIVSAGREAVTPEVLRRLRGQAGPGRGAPRALDNGIPNH
ncbi:MAG: patatin-like phospholipase family protein [Acidobacteria bacterium]|nr:patatin-like phospholipase family protein [Acidobacteriota bacterium]